MQRQTTDTPPQLLSPLDRPLDRASVDTRMKSDLAVEGPGRVTPRLFSLEDDSQEQGKGFFTKGKILGAAVLAAIGLGISQTDVFRNANLPNWRAIPMHPVKRGNANGIQGGVYTSEQGNTPAKNP